MIDFCRHTICRESYYVSSKNAHLLAYSSTSNALGVGYTAEVLESHRFGPRPPQPERTDGVRLLLYLQLSTAN